MIKRISILILITYFFSPIFAQNDPQTMMSSHVYFLSDDRLEGRATGGEGEKIALEYIANYFSMYGLSPKGQNGFVQEFEFSLGKSYSGKNSLSVNGHTLQLDEDFYPLVYSGNGEINANIVDVGFGIHAPDLNYDDYANKTNLNGNVFLINLSSPDGIHPHSKYIEYTDYQTRINTAIHFGASAIVFYNIDKTLNNPKNDLTRNVKSFSIPVVFETNEFLNDGDIIQLSIELDDNERVGHNVIAFIDNGAPSTVAIGAHYDHLGWGESGGSLHRGEPAIHNGADDNASGVALMLELANYLNRQSDLQNNYLFIAFSGEELGLYGSKSFVKNATIDTASLNYMLNFDMVGRLDEENKMAVNGVGTSPTFKEICTSISAGNLTIKTTESGMGPSDHASFYLANIPVLHFYTGNNPDYHKPEDDPHLINYTGMKQIYDYTISLVNELDDDGVFEFQATKDDNNKNAPKFSVTLGVVPDYMFDGEGMRIDGVTEGKPASNAGIKTGDIVKKMGSIDITDMMSYMTALSKFKKGETTIVLVEREKEIVELTVTF